MSNPFRQSNNIYNYELLLTLRWRSISDKSGSYHREAQTLVPQSSFSVKEVNWEGGCMDNSAFTMSTKESILEIRKFYLFECRIETKKELNDAHFSC